MKKKAHATDPIKYRFSVLIMAGKFNYVIEGEDSEIFIQKYTFLPRRERVLGSSVAGFKDNSSRIYIC